VTTVRLASRDSTRDERTYRHDHTGRTGRPNQPRRRAQAAVALLTGKRRSVLAIVDGIDETALRRPWCQVAGLRQPVNRLMEHGLGVGAASGSAQTIAVPFTTTVPSCLVMAA